MSFQHISECLPAELSAVLDEARNRGSDMRASARPATGKATTAVEGARQPSMQRVLEGSHAAMGMKDAVATELSAAQLPLPWEVWTGNGVRKVGIEMMAVYRRNRDVPHRPAAVISMLNWKAAHASSPTRRVAR